MSVIAVGNSDALQNPGIENFIANFIEATTVKKLNKTLNQTEKSMKYFRKTEAERKGKCGLMEEKTTDSKRKGGNK